MLSINIGIFIYVGLIVITIKLTKKIFFLPLFEYFVKKEKKRIAEENKLEESKKDLENVIYKQAEVIKTYHLQWKDSLKKGLFGSSINNHYIKYNFKDDSKDKNFQEKISFYTPNEEELEKIIKKVFDE